MLSATRIMRVQPEQTMCLANSSCKLSSPHLSAMPSEPGRGGSSELNSVPCMRGVAKLAGMHESPQSRDCSLLADPVVVKSMIHTGSQKELILSSRYLHPSVRGRCSTRVCVRSRFWFRRIIFPHLAPSSTMGAVYILPRV